MSEIKTLGSRRVYENRWMKVREDRIVYPDGSESIYGVVEKNDAALIFAMDDEDGVYLVEQFRYPVGSFRKGPGRSRRTSIRSLWLVENCKRKPG